MTLAGSSRRCRPVRQAAGRGREPKLPLRLVLCQSCSLRPHAKKYRTTCSATYHDGSYKLNAFRSPAAALFLLSFTAIFTGCGAHDSASQSIPSVIDTSSQVVSKGDGQSAITADFNSATVPLRSAIFAFTLDANNQLDVSFLLSSDPNVCARISSLPAQQSVQQGDARFTIDINTISFEPFHDPHTFEILNSDVLVPLKNQATLEYAESIGGTIASVSSPLTGQIIINTLVTGQANIDASITLQNDEAQVDGALVASSCLAYAEAKR